MKKAQKNKRRYRISVFRSNKHIYAQLIDDIKHCTIASSSNSGMSEKSNMKRAEKVGEVLAQKAKKKKITKVWFDKGNYKYHGRIKALAEGARKGGLEF